MAPVRRPEVGRRPASRFDLLTVSGVIRFLGAVIAGALVFGVSRLAGVIALALVVLAAAFMVDVMSRSIPESIWVGPQRGWLVLWAFLVSAATLLVINRILTFVFLHSERLRHLVAGGPVLLVHEGSPVDEHLRRAGMTPADLQEALRSRGYRNAGECQEAILETDGTVSVIPRTKHAGP